MTDPAKVRELIERLEAWADPIERGYEVPAAGRVLREAATTLRDMLGVVEQQATRIRQGD